MKKNFALLMVVVLVLGFAACHFLSREDVLSHMSGSIVIEPFQPDSVFAAAKDSEEIFEGMGRVITERKKPADQGYAFFTAFIVPYKNISAGTKVQLYKVWYPKGDTTKEYFYIAK
jgi:hypothetical protein